MQRFINNIVSVLFTFFKFGVIKIFYLRRFNYHLLQRFSPRTYLYFSGKGKINLNQAVRVHSGSRLRVMQNGRLVIGKNVKINYNCMISCMEMILLADGVEIGPNVLIYDHDHDFRVPGGVKANEYRTGEVEIGSNTWIGANCIILRNTKIGKNCIIGAGAIIKGDFPDNTVITQKLEYTIRSYQ